jgi:NitT/TauT family transport system ATP-binding protein
MGDKGISHPAIRLRKIEKQFSHRGQSVVALQEVDIDILPGRFVSIVGPSGCGKSTTLSLIAGLAAPDDGEVQVQGQLVDRVQTNVGFIFQRDALLPWKTVLNNVTMGPLFRGWKSDKANAAALQWIQRVGLTGFEHHYPYQLSGGMRKRVALAQTMVYNPEIILMDEPFSALDVQTRNMLENELLGIFQEEHKTVLFITHDLEEAIALSDEVVVMTARPGRVKASYPIQLPRPRNVMEIRFDPHYIELYEKIWNDLRDEVHISFERQSGKEAK